MPRRPHTIAANLCTALCLLAPASVSTSVSAYGQVGQQESVQILLEDLNQSRQQLGLQALRLDPDLSVCAQHHADLMVATRTLSHDLPDEAGLAERCGNAGAHFSQVAENIASGPSLHGIHQSWMHSHDHYANIATASYTAVGVGVARLGQQIYAVEDFSNQVPTDDMAQMEQRVKDMLAVRGIASTADAAPARKLCAAPQGTGYDGKPPVPKLVVQFASADLDKLGPALDQRLAGDAYRRASVGVCSVSGANGFTRYKVALLLY